MYQKLYGCIRNYIDRPYYTHKQTNRCNDIHKGEKRKSIFFFFFQNCLNNFTINLFKYKD